MLQGEVGGDTQPLSYLGSSVVENSVNVSESSSFSNLLGIWFNVGLLKCLNLYHTHVVHVRTYVQTCSQMSPVCLSC